MGFWDWVSSWFAEKKQPLTSGVPLNEERRHIRNYILRVNGKKVETQGDFEGNLGIYNLTVTPMYGSHNARLILQMKFSRKIVKEMHFYHRGQEIIVEKGNKFSRGMNLAWGPTVTDKVHFSCFTDVLEEVTILFELETGTVQDTINLLQ